MARLPNIICILSDEHFGGAMGHAGDPNVRTPNLDRLASGGVSFSRAYANCPVCTPSRGTIFSGRHAHCGPVQGFFDVYKPAGPSLATMLREGGYRTAYFGKWHCGVILDQVPPLVRERREDYPRHQWVTRTPEWYRGGFEDWFAFEVNNKPFDGFYYENEECNPRRFSGYQTDCLTDMSIDYLKRRRGEQPLLMVLSVEPPHFPLEAPERNRRLDPAALKVPPHFSESPEMRAKLATYYAMVENLDENVGRLFEALGGLEHFRDNTLVCYISDHGDFMGTHGRIENKCQPYEESVRIPCIFHWPGVVPPRGLRDEMISLVDFVPTVLGLAGIKAPAHVQGRDMSAAVRDEPHAAQDAILLEMHGAPRWGMDNPDWRGLATRRWKYCFYETGHELLFDLASDPREQHNLAAEMPAERAEMRALLLKMLAATREPYFDVLMEHGVPVSGVMTSVSQHSMVGRGVSPWWHDGSVRYRGAASS